MYIPTHRIASLHHHHRITAGAPTKTSGRAGRITTSHPPFRLDLGIATLKGPRQIRPAQTSPAIHPSTHLHATTPRSDGWNKREGGQHGREQEQDHSSDLGGRVQYPFSFYFLLSVFFGSWKGERGFNRQAGRRLGIVTKKERTPRVEEKRDMTGRSMGGWRERRAAAERGERGGRRAWNVWIHDIARARVGGSSTF